MLNAGEKLFAYGFSGYWKDVGTIQSLWEANMDLLGKEPLFNLYERDWRIFFRNNPLPPHFIGNGGTVNNSIVTEGCEIYGSVTNSVLFNSVKIGKNATVKDSVIFPGAIIEDGASVEYSIIDSDAVISAGVHIGAPKDVAKDITVIGGGLKITKNNKIDVGAMVNELTLTKPV
jgi:glucose-1-phosphate adenylyltransferase